MRKTKRLLSILLALCMALALLPATALADDTDGLSSEAGEVELSPDELGLLREEQWDEEYTVPSSGTPVEIDMTASGLPAATAAEAAGIAPAAAAVPVTARYTVLVLDCSGSMGGQPVQKMKEAAESFCEQMAADSSSNYVAIVPFDNSVWTVTPFTNDASTLTAAVRALYASGGTDLNAALLRAGELLAAQPGGTGIVKNILVLSDGLPQSGATKTDGRYTSSDDYYYYAYANACYETARDELWPHYNVYTLGFLHDVGSQKAFCARFLRDLQNRLYYEVQDGDQLQFVFDELFEDLGTTEDTDPIVVIPGIPGSRLWTSGTEFNDSTEIWSSENDVIELSNFVQSGQTLYVRPCENQQNATSREYGARDMYQTLVDDLCAKFPERDVYFFSYDWTKSCADAAKELSDAIQTILNGSESTKVDLVCHSMGGLVASSYFDQYESYGNRAVDKVITCGTPYEGTPTVIDYVNSWNGPLSSFTGVAETAPTAQYTALEPMGGLKGTEYAEKMQALFDSGLYDQAAAFQEGVRENGANNLLDYHKSFFAVGIGQKTISSVVFDADGSTINDLTYETRGDGSVPYLSATMNYEVRNNLYYGERWKEFNVGHKELVTDSECINWIADVLESGKGVTATGRLNPQGYIVLRIACPVDVTLSAKGETLSSVRGAMSTYASFGGLTVIGSQTDPVKMLCLDIDTYNNLQLTGTGDGEMDFTVRYFDADGTLISEKSANDVPVTANTVYTTTVPASKDTVLTLVDTQTGKVIPVEQDVNFVPVEDNHYPDVPDYLEREESNKQDTSDARSNYIAITQTTGGEVVPSTRRAAIGELVSLSVNPDEGYELDTLTITDSRGRTLSYRSLGNNRYSFIMTGFRVTVDAKFVKTQGNNGSASTPDDDEPFTGLGTPGISGIVLNPAAMPFTDVRAGDWFYDNVDYVWKHYLMSGVSDSQFAPSLTTSRGMIWTILARMNNIRTDINPGSTWYERGMLWAMEQGVTDGSNAMGDITREQLATMLWRNAGRPAPGEAADLSRFSDSDTVSSYATTAVRWAVSMGILKGTDGQINPQGTATRAQVAAMVARYGDKVAI